MDLRRLRAALIADLEPEIQLALKVGVLHAAGHRRSEMIRQLGVTSHEMARAVEMVKRAAERLDGGDASRP